MKALREGARLFVTGATGFVGRVVLSELLRQRESLNIESVVLAIRARKGESAQARFDQELATSACFSRLPPDWQQSVSVVEGDLSEPGCGLRAEDRATLADSLTHIIHCAASVEFDLPLDEATRANVTSALNVLELAKSCRALKTMVSVSTAYVTPHRKDGRPCAEELVPLPFSAREVYDDILAGRADRDLLLAATGHPNTYTFTKCLTEHLLMENRGEVALTIVRPSIVGACWEHPFPGWITGYMGFAGFAAIIGLGRMRALVADERTGLDVVPCDQVAARCIAAAFAPPAPALPRIRHAVAGIQNASRVDMSIEEVSKYFRDHPNGPLPGIFHVGPHDVRYELRHAVHHLLPMRVAEAWLATSRQTKQKRRVGKLLERIEYLNREFPYFTSQTFDFQTSSPMRLAGFTPRRYVRLICRGISRHLFNRDDRRVPLVGRNHRSGERDLPWTSRQPSGNAVIRAFGYGVRKGLRRGSELVTFDKESFEEAIARSEPGTRYVVIPSHRSYLDFVLCSYLFFGHPSLGVSIPYIAAANDFARIKVLGPLLQRARAFYIRRGQAREDVELSQQIRDLVARGETLQFFIEGGRSRSGAFLPPKRGLLRCLQSTGERFTVLPVSITYDRVPEEAALARELTGAPRPPMQLRKLMGWLGQLAKGEVELGRIHMACGRPLTLDAKTDVPALANAVVGELQSRMVSTTHHLEQFLARTGCPDIDLAWLTHAIECRGGEVIASGTHRHSPASGELELGMRWNFLHHFYPEARVLFEGHPALDRHLQRHDFAKHAHAREAMELADPRMERFLKTLFGPILRDYSTAAKLAGAPSEAGPRHRRPEGVVQAVPGAYQPYVEDAYEDLVARGFLKREDKQQYGWGPHAHEFEAFRRALESNPVGVLTQLARAAGA